MKAARLYCRSNVAFNNFMNMTFKGIAQFRQVECDGAGGKKYMGLTINILKPDGTSAEEIIMGAEEE